MITPIDKYWPLLVHVFEGHTTQTQLDAWFRWVDGFFNRKQKALTLCVARDLKLWDPTLLRHAANWMRDHRELIQAYQVGFGFVLPSPVVRGMLKALLWMQPLPHPHHVTSTVPEALTWLRHVAQANRITLPDFTGLADLVSDR